LLPLSFTLLIARTLRPLLLFSSNFPPFSFHPFVPPFLLLFDLPDPPPRPRRSGFYTSFLVLPLLNIYLVMQRTRCPFSSSFPFGYWVYTPALPPPIYSLAHPLFAPPRPSLCPIPPIAPFPLLHPSSEIHFLASRLTAVSFCHNKKVPPPQLSDSRTRGSFRRRLRPHPSFSAEHQTFPPFLFPYFIPVIRLAPFCEYPLICTKTPHFQLSLDHGVGVRRFICVLWSWFSFVHFGNGLVLPFTKANSAY